MNTMHDLRREVAQRMEKALDGREIDMRKQITPRLPHILGITDIDTVHDPIFNKETLLDPSIQFWQDYENSVRTKNAVVTEIRTAMESLQSDGLFNVSRPYEGESVLYVEVDCPEERNNE